LYTLHSFTFHITVYDLTAIAAIITGVNFALLLAFTKSSNRTANSFLSLALAGMVVSVAWLLAIHVDPVAHLSSRGWLPIQLSLATGPLIYCYVLKLTRPGYKFSRIDLLHFCPLLLSVILILAAKNAFTRLIPALQLSLFISVAAYLYRAYGLIPRFHQLLINATDRHRHELWRLRRLLAGFGLLLLMGIIYAALAYRSFDNQQTLNLYYVICLVLAVIVIWLAAVAFSWPEVRLPVAPTPVPKPLPSAELADKGAWLKNALKAGQLHQDAALSVSSLAEKLEIPAHEVSRIINTALKKNFNDFVNEYRVRDVIEKMQDPAYDHITILGIAFESGFNSKSTFNRTFRQMTGKSPAEYKVDLKKDGPFSNLRRHAQVAPLFLNDGTTTKWSVNKFNRSYMFKNYLKITWRNLIRHKTHTFINITGLAVGMAVAMLIGLWIWDELSYDKYFQNYDTLVRVMQHQTFNGEVGTQGSLPLPLGPKLRENYTGPGKDFKYVVMATWTWNHIVAYGDKKLFPEGTFMQPEAPEMFTLKMLKGTRAGLKDQSSILLSAGLAKALFGDADPLNKIIKIDSKYTVAVTGVYEDLPHNTSLNEMAFMLPWDLYINNDPSLKNNNEWSNNSWQMFAQLNPDVNIDNVSAHIRNLKKDALIIANDKLGISLKPVLFVYPASKWYLYSEFKNGVVTGGKIEFVWLFGIIGIFVLLLACINFMNLSTARSEKRAKEVGIRKTLGSLRRQLISQFFTESVLVVVFSFFLCIVLVLLILPWFNQVADKDISILWTSPIFWTISLGFGLFTGFIAGSYPAFYLSAFQPVKVLKGTFRADKQAALPRQVLVVLQFTVSVALIIGTVVVFRQIQFTKNRQVGYTRAGLLQVTVQTPNIHNQYDAVKHDLAASGAITDMAESWSPVTDIWSDDSGFKWEGMPPGLQPDMAIVGINPDFGKTVRWQITQGRDFSRAYLGDSAAFLINETAVNFMGLRNPIGTIVSFYGKNFKIVGVVKDMVMSSPYNPVSPTVFRMITGPGGIITLRLSPRMPPNEAVDKIQSIFKQYAPENPFTYHFADSEYAKKFADEERTGKLAGFFTILAIFISCMGLFGMASFMAEQRVKEIGVRKVLGASVASLWGLMSKEFVVLVGIALLIAMPSGYFFMAGWLLKYNYHAGLSWWIFAATAVGAMAITLFTVSFQALKAAIANPVSSLRSE